MGKLNVDIDDRLDDDFRDIKNKAKGHRFPLSDAVEEALILWVNKQKALLKEEVAK
jgi:hypothetical protein